MPRTAKKPVHKHHKPFSLTSIYDILIRGSESVPVGTYHLQIATAEQLCRLHYAKGSLKTIKARLKTLVDEGFLQADGIPMKFARSPYYYALDHKAVQFLEEAGYDTRAYFRPSKEVNKSSLFLNHTLELNDVLIAGALLHTINPSYKLHSFIHERNLKHTPYRAKWQKAVNDTYKEEIHTLIPDGFMDFSYTTPEGKQKRTPIILEHDRGTIEQKQFRRRIRAYLVFLKQEAYKELFNTHKITIAFTTFSGEKRVTDMRQWTRAELAATKEPKHLASSFLFTSLPPLLDPQQLFIKASWYTPFDTDKNKPVKPVPLLAN